MTGWDTGLQAARLLCAAAVIALVSGEAAAQGAPSPPPPPPPDAAELDPSAPLDPMPDLGIAWPDLNATEPAPATIPAGPKAQASASAVTDENSQIRYALIVEGLNTVGGSEDLLKTFRKQ